jgi:hypothetical protein
MRRWRSARRWRGAVGCRLGCRPGFRLGPAEVTRVCVPGASALNRELEPQPDLLARRGSLSVQPALAGLGRQTSTASNATKISLAPTRWQCRAFNSCDSAESRRFCRARESVSPTRSANSSDLVAVLVALVGESAAMLRGRGPAAVSAIAKLAEVSLAEELADYGEQGRRGAHARCPRRAVRGQSPDARCTTSCHYRDPPT